MDGVKTFLTRTGPFGLPVYAYVGGAVALIGGIWYFKTHNTGNATVAPQTNPVTDAITPPPVVPFPSGAGTPVPPSSAFITPQSGASVGAVGTGSVNSTVTPSANPLPTSTANFIPTVPQPTTSQAFSSSIVSNRLAAGTDPGTIPGFATPIQPTNYVPAASTPTQVASVVRAVAKVPIIGPIVTKIFTPAPVPITTASVSGRRSGGNQMVV